MTKAPIFRGTVEHGRLKLDLREKFKVVIDSLEGKKIEIILRERSAARSNDSNNYYWKVVVSMIGDHLGYEKYECHDALKEKFNVTSTSKMNTREFQDYVTRVVRFAATELNLVIPEPHNVEY